jgi:hypothetical protein
LEGYFLKNSFPFLLRSKNYQSVIASNNQGDILKKNVMTCTLLREVRYLREKTRSNYTPRITLGAFKSPLASLGLSLFAKIIKGTTSWQAGGLPRF